MALLAPSILSADFANLGRDIEITDKAGADVIHIDVMDGLFVPSISFGMPVIKSIRKTTEKTFDVHLMITNPIRYIERFAADGADGITVHAEACEDLADTIDEIINHGKKAGVAISPDTGIDVIMPVLHKVSMVLVMTVYPGYGGQSIITETFEKVRMLRTIANEKKLDLDIEVDGGVNLDNIGQIMDAGANVFVAGTKIFKGDVRGNVKNFREVFEKRK